jgi:isopenicillin-N epimerase
MDGPAQIGRSASSVTEWALDPTVTFLNHGSFGACLRAILEVQRRWRDKIEMNPVRFLARDLEDLLDWSRSEIGGFVGANADDLALMPNATAGINTVLRSMRWKAGDEVITTDHAYAASLNALRFAAAGCSARVVLARIPFPIESSDAAFDAIMAAVTPNTKFAMLDHVTSPTALILPIERLVPALAEKGIDVLVDGAHAPGMLPLRIASMAPAYYVGTAHKWVCAPKGSAFLYVRRDRQGWIKPLAISNGASDTRTDRPRFRLDFDWNGTFDPSPWLTIPAAIDGLGEMLPGGWPSVIANNRQLMIAAREMLAAALHTDVQAPDEMTGSMASLRLPGGPWPRADALRRKEMIETALRGRLFEVPLMTWPCTWLVDSGDLPESTEFELIVRISAHAYNHFGQFERLASILSGFAGVNRPQG